MIPQVVVSSDALRKDLGEVLDMALKTFDQTEDDVMVLKIHGTHVFDQQSCWARVLVKRKGARQTWWVKSLELPEEPDWSEALGMLSNDQRKDGWR